MNEPTPEQRVRDWWRTDIIDMSPGIIRLRGYAIEDLIGKVGYADMVWLMLRGELPESGQARLLEAALIASVDHGPQSPAIAIARMAVTSGNAINNAMGSAVNVLGDTHGGAGQQCMELLQRISGNPGFDAAPEQTVAEELERFRAEKGRHVPGFGHRFHAVDPRVSPLLALVDRAVQADVVKGRHTRIARLVEAHLAQGRAKPIPMNIDGITAAIFCELGFAPVLGRGLFVLSRSVGILAHAWEQMQQAQRIKGPTPPDFLYTYGGPPPRRLGSEGEPAVS